MVTVIGSARRTSHRGIETHLKRVTVCPGLSLTGNVACRSVNAKCGMVNFAELTVSADFARSRQGERFGRSGIQIHIAESDGAGAYL